MLFGNERILSAGISHLQGNALQGNDFSADGIANFLRHTPGLDKEQVRPHFLSLSFPLVDSSHLHYEFLLSPASFSPLPFMHTFLFPTYVRGCNPIVHLWIFSS